MLRFIAILQGLYFLSTGVWALVSIDSFRKVTGPKTDLWLVKTVGALISVIGLVLIVSTMRGNIGFEIFLLAIGCNIVLTAIDVNYVIKRVISKIYLLDAIGEMIFILLWLTALWLNFE